MRQRFEGLAGDGEVGGGGGASRALGEDWQLKESITIKLKSVSVWGWQRGVGFLGLGEGWRSALDCSCQPNNPHLHQPQTRPQSIKNTDGAAADGDARTLRRLSGSATSSSSSGGPAALVATTPTGALKLVPPPAAASSAATVRGSLRPVSGASSPAGGGNGGAAAVAGAGSVTAVDPQVAVQHQQQQAAGAAATDNDDDWADFQES